MTLRALATLAIVAALATAPSASAEATADKQANGPTGQQADEFVVAVVNFTPVTRNRYRIGVPAGGEYVEVLNSDADVYGGSNAGNQGKVVAERDPLHGHAFSLSLTVPPLGFVLLKPNNSKRPNFKSLDPIDRRTT